MTGTALILGGSGKFGSHAARALDAAGWKVRCFDRKNDDLNQVAQGTDIIVNGLNPPGYRNWATEIPRITALAIGAAKASGATLIVPGNVYPFGSTPGLWDENTPHRPTTRKGKIRTEMEQTYRRAAKDGVRTILIRAGDFIGTGPTENWIDQILAKIGKGRFIYPGDAGITHAWAYLPDLGRAVAALSDTRAELSAYEDIPFPGYSLTGNQMRHVLENVTARPLQLKKFPWWLIRLISPFWRLGGELQEMRYLWDTPHALSAAKFVRLVPDWIATPLETAMACALPADIHPNKAVLRNVLRT